MVGHPPIAGIPSLQPSMPADIKPHLTSASLKYEPVFVVVVQRRLREMVNRVAGKLGASGMQLNIGVLLSDSLAVCLLRSLLYYRRPETDFNPS